MEEIPLIEFDPDRKGLIEPEHIHKDIGLPEHCVMPFYGSLAEKLRRDGRLEKVHQLASLTLTPIGVHKMEFEGKPVTVAGLGVGAPLAAAILEELIALGCRKFVACGSAGVLKTELQRGAVIIPGSAVRDEGTSYHYCPPSREIEMDRDVVDKLEQVLRKHHVDYEIGKTWTTDAFYRETRGKIARRKVEGCLTVDMECSALLAVARFRNVKFGQYLAAGDDVSGDEWDPRYVNFKMTIQEKIFWLSVEACLSL
jgi:uridine phosphorylase